MELKRHYFGGGFWRRRRKLETEADCGGGDGCWRRRRRRNAQRKSTRLQVRRLKVNKEELLNLDFLRIQEIMHLEIFPITTSQHYFITPKKVKRLKANSQWFQKTACCLVVILSCSLKNSPIIFQNNSKINLKFAVILYI